jgi:hypothetical protein
MWYGVLGETFWEGGVEGWSGSGSSDPSVISFRVLLNMWDVLGWMECAHSVRQRGHGDWDSEYLGRGVGGGGEGGGRRRCPRTSEREMDAGWIRRCAGKSDV